MNRHIKDLVRRCGGISHDEDGKELSPMLIGDNVEKFALLLLEECIYEISDLMDITEFDLKTLRAARSAVQEHFGRIV